MSDLARTPAQCRSVKADLVIGVNKAGMSMEVGVAAVYGIRVPNSVDHFRWVWAGRSFITAGLKHNAALRAVRLPAVWAVGGVPG